MAKFIELNGVKNERYLVKVDEIAYIVDVAETNKNITKAPVSNELRDYGPNIRTLVILNNRNTLATTETYRTVKTRIRKAVGEYGKHK